MEAVFVIFYLFGIFMAFGFIKGTFIKAYGSAEYKKGRIVFLVFSFWSWFAVSLLLLFSDEKYFSWRLKDPDN